ncbi:glycine zipper domain-containing protein [Wohlfahrtiimonas chitiniclastica]|uniref:Glycine zipper 2TM domain-containing protein n=2 Tax=Wohlfahrtiimonas chitiniclastica TaxID=400946 RepID=L8Y2Y4_9GAMM|nr:MULTISPECIES: glycine zipper 2TM domain-containing protein [Wohlfahrtiimonas]ELV08811.1 Hypothetical protein F387_00203 [Wohlfahrtiimonas chitiniclastica SH04]KZS22479.1 hypothetical protein BMY_0299 [Wohlfahrtiimonas chitiniclastica]KZX37996.1 ornithine carbamoyltransferase [Wohlfahrtiimonas chitiniclastica]MBS7813931.1 glycine zipper 2TM domain-containing protein [Wohlfahrtiimonas chitiniclastica]MBS7816194.1 glycine zipper 2TM domain-containing protein [Wohlfahrtiimonas chitiniclastica]
MKTFIKLTAVMTMIGLLAGCSTWNSMSTREKDAVAGAGVGAVTGAWLFDGAVLGTVGGAAVGGLIGDQVGKSTDHK